MNQRVAVWWLLSFALTLSSSYNAATFNFIRSYVTKLAWGTGILGLIPDRVAAGRPSCLLSSLAVRTQAVRVEYHLHCALTSLIEAL